MKGFESIRIIVLLHYAAFLTVQSGKNCLCTAFLTSERLFFLRLLKWGAGDKEYITESKWEKNQKTEKELFLLTERAVMLSLTTWPLFTFSNFSAYSSDLVLEATQDSTGLLLQGSILLFLQSLLWQNPLFCCIHVTPGCLCVCTVSEKGRQCELFILH